MYKGKLPAYIRLKFGKKCDGCQQMIESNQLAFWIGDYKLAYHGKCGKNEWKIAGSPYAIRQQAAMAHEQVRRAEKAAEEIVSDDPRKL